MKRILSLAVFAFLGGTIVLAQAPPMPKPGPEHQKLHYFVGEWKTTGDMKPGPMGPGGKFTSTDHNQMLGDFFLVINSDGSGAMGNFKEVAVLGYDSAKKSYTYNAFNSMGEHEVSSGQVSGDTWTWLSPEQEMAGKKMKGRFILKEASPTEYTFKFDMSVNGGEWQNAMEGKASKVK